MAIERRAVQSGGRWVVVAIDDVRIQCTTPAVDSGHYYVQGYGQQSIDTCAAWAAQHGRSYASRAEAEAVEWVE